MKSYLMILWSFLIEFQSFGPKNWISTDVKDTLLFVLAQSRQKVDLWGKSSIISVTITYWREEIVDAFWNKAFVKLIQKCYSVKFDYVHDLSWIVLMCVLESARRIIFY